MSYSLRRNNVHVFGNGPRVLVFAHGLGADQTTWRRLMPHFEASYRVVLFDYVGSGGSAREAYDPVRYSSLQGYAQDVIDMCSELGFDEVVFIGHSVSAMIGVLAAIQQPRSFERLVLLASSPRYVNDSPHYFGGFEAYDVEQLLTLMDNNFLTWATTFADVAIKDPIYAREFKDSFCATDPVNFDWYSHLTIRSKPLITNGVGSGTGVGFGRAQIRT